MKYIIMATLFVVLSCTTTSKVDTKEPEVQLTQENKLPICEDVDAYLCTTILQAGGKVFSMNTMERNGVTHFRRVLQLQKDVLFIYFINEKDASFAQYHRQFEAMGKCRNGDEIYEMSAEIKPIPEDRGDPNKIKEENTEPKEAPKKM